jgi:nitrogen regulatory protein P-II 1
MASRLMTKSLIVEAMKLIKCIIQPHKLEEVLTALRDVIPGMSVTEVRGYGRQKGRSIVYRGQEYEVTLLPKAMIEIVAADNWVDDIVKLVIDTAGTGEIGDGRIFVLPIEENYHVRTGFMDLD